MQIFRKTNITYPLIRTSLLNYVPYASSRLCALRVLRAFRSLRAFVPYALSCLINIPALRALFARLIYAPCFVLFSSIFQVLKIFLGQICSPGETSHFSRTGKEATNRAIFMWVTKQP